MDWVAQVETLPQKDSLVLAHSCEKYPGGSAANVAVGIARLGCSVGFVGKLGDDEHGRLLLRAFEREKVDTRGVIIEVGRPSATCFIGVDSQGDRVIFSLPGVSLVESAAELDLVQLSGRALYLGPSRVQVVRAAAAAAIECGMTVIFAPGGGWGPQGLAQLRPTLEQVDVLLLSRSEVEELTGMTELTEAVRLLGQAGPPVVIATLGAQGAIILEHGRLKEVMALDAPLVRDTTGAGDAFAAGLVTGCLEGMDWTAAARLGCATAAMKIGHRGARNGLPSRKEVAQFMNERSES